MKTIRTLKQIWLTLLRLVKWLDFSIQSLLLFFMIVLNALYPKEWVLIIWSGYMVLGLWQLTSSLLFALVRAPFLKARVIHLFLSAAFLSCFAVYPGDVLSSRLAMVLPGLPALLYYGITARWTFDKPVSRGFLPHINF